MRNAPTHIDRRTFLKLAGAGSVAFAAGCRNDPEKKLYASVEALDDSVTGRPVWYASTCRECPAGCGVLAKNREGRVIKLEGNPLHPINQGKLCMRGQAALQGVFNPDRVMHPLLKEDGKWRRMSFLQAHTLLREKASQARKKSKENIRLVTEAVGESLMAVFAESLEQCGSTSILVYEAFAHEAMKTAMDTVFGLPVLPSVQMDRADFLVSFGADFLETWLSPVEYARKFELMRRVKNGQKTRFIHISPFQSLTAANADRWICCKPGSEAAILFGLIRSALAKNNNGKDLPDPLISAIRSGVSPFTRQRVLDVSGISAAHYQALENQLFSARNPLVLGTGAGSGGENGFQAEMGAILLNLILDPDLTLFDFTFRHRVETAARRAEAAAFFASAQETPAGLLLINNTDPAYTLAPGSGARRVEGEPSPFVVSFSNFMTETAAGSDLIFPVRLPLETWDEYGGKTGIVSTQQPAMGRLTQAPSVGDVLLRCFFNENRPAPDYKRYLMERLTRCSRGKEPMGWLNLLEQGGLFPEAESAGIGRPPLKTDLVSKRFIQAVGSLSDPAKDGFTFVAIPSIRFYDGRSANRPWLCEIPDPLTQVAWQTTLQMHPEALNRCSLKQGDTVAVHSDFGALKAPVFETEGIHPKAIAMSMGQGHLDFGRCARGVGVNPLRILPPSTDPISGAPRFSVPRVSIEPSGKAVRLAKTDGSRFQQGRKIALAVDMDALGAGAPRKTAGFTMHDFPLTLPLPEGYDPKRDFYPPHDHADYRWGMTVDLDRCIGCGACAAACYAENSIGIVGEKQVVEGREMSWLRIERYHDPARMDRIIFFPMMCQHCDNAPCEAVCPVYAPHHSKEGLNNQIYNRCIGTRFCAQNCPYKVRRFNWFRWDWPSPLDLQLNPDVTVRIAGVMEKCSFCIQRIKQAHGVAKNENRGIRDGEIQPACMQTCPTGAIVFGNLMDRNSRVRQLAEGDRAYQAMGYLNTKPAVFYLKKVVQNI